METIWGLSFCKQRNILGSKVILQLIFVFQDFKAVRPTPVNMAQPAR